jgi:hypothetical protein
MRRDPCGDKSVWPVWQAQAEANHGRFRLRFAMTAGTLAGSSRICKTMRRPISRPTYLDPIAIAFSVVAAAVAALAKWLGWF